MRYEEVAERALPAQLDLLQAHLPFSLALYRRLQVAAGAYAERGSEPGDGGTTEHARVLFVYGAADAEARAGAFVAAYVDLSRAPETAVYLYASDEDGHRELPADGAARCRPLVLAVLRRVRGLAAEQAHLPAVAAYSTAGVKVSMHDGLRAVVTGPGDPTAGGPGVRAASWFAYERWPFRMAASAASAAPGVSADPGLADPADPALVWDVVRRADAALVQSRTAVPRPADTLVRLPSAALREAASGTLAAWAFLGVDGTVWTLHCEERYRGRGLARALTARLLQQMDVFGDAPWCCADIAADNAASQAVFRRLGGRHMWTTTWVVLRYEGLGEAKPGEWA